MSFIEGVGEGGTKYAGICAGPDGRLYCAPCNADTLLAIETETQTLSWIEGAGEGGWKQVGMSEGPDGRLYCAAAGSCALRRCSVGETQRLHETEG